VWVRYRSYAASLWHSLEEFVHAYNNPVPQDATPWLYVKGEAPPPPFPSYPLSAEEARELSDLTRSGVGAVGQRRDPVAAVKAPRPTPDLRQVPHP
jgi:hypothetical protein